MAAGTAAPIETKRPSGAFVSVTHDGFEIQSNTGTADELRSDLGLGDEGTPAPGADGGEPAREPMPTRARTGKPRHDPEARVSQAVARQREAERRAEEAERKAQELEARIKAPTPLPPAPAAVQPSPPAAPQPPRPAPVAYDGADPNDPEPTIDLFVNDPDPYGALVRASAAHATRKEWRKQEYAVNLRAQRQQAEVTFRERDARIRKSFVEAEAKHGAEWKAKIDPQIATALTWGGVPEDPGTLLGNLIADAENPADYLIYFSEHKDDFQRISALHPLHQGVAFGEIKGRLAAAASGSAPKPRPVTQARPVRAPLPTTPQAAAFEDDDRPDDELSDAEHEARYAKLRRQHR